MSAPPDVRLQLGGRGPRGRGRRKGAAVRRWRRRRDERHRDVAREVARREVVTP